MTRAGVQQRPIRRSRLALVAIGVLCLAMLGSAATAGARSASPALRVTWMSGFAAPGTPANLNRVGVIKVGPKNAKNVLVLMPGTSAGGAYFVPLAQWLVTRVKGWQVWSVERRENQLEDSSVLDQAKSGHATSRQLFDYYLGSLTNPSIRPKFQAVADSTVPFARNWGMDVTVEDLKRVITAAKTLGGKVVLGGHSLGGSVVDAYATWDFNGTAGAKDLSGLVFIDGGSNPTPASAQQATASLQSLASSTPWLAFGGIPAPLLGLYSATGSTLATMDPNTASVLQTWPALPSYLKTAVRVTNEAGFGYAVDTKTSPRSLAAAQVHAGQLAASGDPRGWDRAGAITPVQRWASMLSGSGIQGADGSEWYFPMRLTIDTGAVGDGNANPAQQVLDVKAIHGDQVNIPIYAFGAALGGQGVLDSATTLANQSHLPSRELTLINRASTYAHNDPSAAYPNNDFVSNLIPFLNKIGSGHP
jgi:hypothetical protein